MMRVPAQEPQMNRWRTLRVLDAVRVGPHRARSQAARRRHLGQAHPSDGPNSSNWSGMAFIPLPRRRLANASARSECAGESWLYLMKTLGIGWFTENKVDVRSEKGVDLASVFFPLFHSLFSQSGIGPLILHVKKMVQHVLFKMTIFDSEFFCSSPPSITQH